MREPNSLRRTNAPPVLDRAFSLSCTCAFLLLLGSVAQAVYLYIR